MVKFGDTTVEFVPTKWVIADRLCLWPERLQNSRVVQLIKDCADPEENWDLFSCTCMASFSKCSQSVVLSYFSVPSPPDKVACSMVDMRYQIIISCNRQL